MRSTSPKALVLASAGYLVSASIGAAHAVAMHLPARFGGLLTGNDVLRDFLLINGTALSPDLVLLLGQVVLTGLALRHGRSGRVGVIGLTLLGAAFALGELGEPITRRAFAPATFSATLAVLVTANIVFPAMMVMLGALEWRRRSGIGRLHAIPGDSPARHETAHAGGRP